MKFTFTTNELGVVSRKLEAAKELCEHDPGVYEIDLCVSGRIHVLGDNRTAYTCVSECVFEPVSREAGRMRFVDRPGDFLPAEQGPLRWQIEIREL